MTGNFIEIEARPTAQESLQIIRLFSTLQTQADRDRFLAIVENFVKSVNDRVLKV
jgi:hypothetical protein